MNTQISDNALSSSYWSQRVHRRGLIRNALLGVAGVGGAALIGCGDGGESGEVPSRAIVGATGEPTRGGQLRIATVSNASTLDPAFSLGHADTAITQAFADNLVQLMHDFSLKPMLAQSWEPSDDLSEYVIHVRPEVRFHHGKDLDANDVVTTFRRLIDPDVGSPASSSLSSIQRIEEIDPLTVRFVLDGPNAFLPESLSIYQARILPADIDPERYGTEASGTGPFKVAEFRPGEHGRLIRNDEYWDSPRPYLDEVTMFYMPEPVARMEALRSGQADVVTPLEPAQVRPAEADGMLVSVRESPGYLNLAMRVDRPPFSDVRVRRALQSLTDRDLINEAANFGLGSAGNDHPIPPADPHFWQGQVQPGFDPAEARRQLDAAGVTSGTTLTLHTSTVSPGMQEMAVTFRELAREGGINVEIQRSSEDAYWSNVWMVEPFTTVAWNGRNADEALSIVYLTGAVWNESFYSNAEVDRLIVAARAIRDQEERTETYGRVEQILIDEVPRIVPAFKPALIAQRPGIGGLSAHPSTWLLLHDVWLES